MKLHLTAEEMMGYWRLLRGYEPLRSDHAVVRRDGVDLDALLQKEIDAWYASLLDTAPASMLAPEEIASSLTAVRHADNSVTVVLPDSCRRLLSITLEGWERPAVPVDAADAEATLNAQANPYSRGGAAEPVAILFPNRLLRLFSLPASVADAEVASAVAVVEPDGTFYDFDSSALTTIASFDINKLP